MVARARVAAAVVLLLPFWAAAPAAADGPNLLANPGFEVDADGDGSPDGWRVLAGPDSHVVLSPVLSHGGARSLQVAGKGYVSVESPSHAIPPGTPVRLSGWLRDPLGTLQLEARLSHGGSMSGRVHGADWERVDLDFVMPWGSPAVTVELRQRYDATGAPAADDLELRVVPGDGNLVSNGGFEHSAVPLSGSPTGDPDMWGPAEGDGAGCKVHAITGDHASEGARSLRLETQPAKSRCAWWSQPAPASPGTSFRAGADVWLGAGKAMAKVQFFDAQGRLIGSQRAERLDPGPWQRLEAEACAPPGTVHARALLHVNSTTPPTPGLAHWDRARLEALGTCTFVPPPVQDLLVNGGFEAGPGAPGWTLACVSGFAGTVSSPVHDGALALRLANDPGKPGCTATQRVPMGEDEVFTTSWWQYREKAPNGGVVIRMLDHEDQPVLTIFTGAGVVGTWKYRASTWMARPGTVAVEVTLESEWTYSTFGSAEVFDQVGLTRGAAPAT